MVAELTAVVLTIVMACQSNLLTAHISHTASLSGRRVFVLLYVLVFVLVFARAYLSHAQSRKEEILVILSGTFLMIGMAIPFYGDFRFTDSLHAFFNVNASLALSAATLMMAADHGFPAPMRLLAMMTLMLCAGIYVTCGQFNGLIEIVFALYLFGMSRLLTRCESD